MVLSASRRTDIPNYYSDWFFNRLEEGFLYVRNPMNVHQVSKILLSPKVIDCIVFWTKNPEPMIKRLGELKDYPYYFQFTLTGYGKDIEPNVPHKREKMLSVFQLLSDKIGSHRVIWRYDPIFFNETYTKEYHLEAFRQIASALNGYTRKCIISFVDFYAKNKRNMDMMHCQELELEDVKIFAKRLSEMAHSKGMEIAACAEQMDLTDCGIVRSACIDKALIEKITGCRLRGNKDKNQRKECGCLESVEIGCYNTCRNGCRYCYANYSPESVRRQCGNYDVDSPLLCSVIGDGDLISERKLESLREQQISLPFMDN